MKIKKLLTLTTGMIFLLSACIPFYRSSSKSLEEKPNEKNGELIYFTATTNRAGKISFRGGPAFGGMMMGSYLTCASCHGPTGQGGRHTMHMSVMDAPDIRFVSLAEEMEEHGGEEGEYTLDTFKKAVIDGKHPDGDALDRDMPRWKMSEADLADLFAFLQSLE